MWHVIVQIAAVAVLVGVAGSLVATVRNRRAGVRRRGVLERTQAVVWTVAMTAFAVSVFVGSTALDVVWCAGVFVALGIGIVRSRRGEPWYPSYL